MKTRKVDGMPFGLKKPNRVAAMTTYTRWTQPMPPLLGALACPAMTPVCADLERRGLWMEEHTETPRTNAPGAQAVVTEGNVYWAEGGRPCLGSHRINPRN